MAGSNCLVPAKNQFGGIISSVTRPIQPETMTKAKCTVHELETILRASWNTHEGSSFFLAMPEGCDEVYPNIFISDGREARDLEVLKKIGITHVLNVAQGPGPFYVNTNADYYKGDGIEFLGLNCDDDPSYNLSQHFEETTNYIQMSLDSGGKVLVHCIMGISRAPTTVMAYLMKKQGMTVREAVKNVTEKRDIHPNEGFFQQLCDLNEELFG